MSWLDDARAAGSLIAEYNTHASEAVPGARDGGYSAQNSGDEGLGPPPIVELGSERAWLLEAERVLTEMGPVDPRYSPAVEKWLDRLRVYRVNVLQHGEPL